MSNDGGTPQPEGGTGGRRVLPFVITAALSLGVGAGIALLILRARTGTPPASAPSAAPATPAPSASDKGEMAGMPGMEPSGAPPTEPSPVPGGKAVYISPGRQQLIGVRTAVVEPRELATTIRTVGTLAYDETRVTEVHTKISGWVEQVYVDYVGKPVRRGQPLFTVYSPDLVSTQNEYLLALRNRAQLSTSSLEATRASADALLAATLSRLKLWDVPDEHIAELERTGKVQRTLMLHSPFSGVVLERKVFPGQYVTPEMATFRIADLSSIWAIGSVFEYEQPLVKVGQTAEIEFPFGQSTRAMKGRIAFIDPEVDPQTRRVRFRAEFANPGLQLKPETYVTILLSIAGGRALAVPKEAVIDTGTRRYAILALPNGYFEPRDIEAGPLSDEYYIVLGGLKEGDRIVTSAQFIIDSETNLQAAMQSMIGMPGMEASPKPKETGHQQHEK